MIDLDELYEKSQCMFMLGNDVAGLEYQAIAKEISMLRSTIDDLRKKNDQLKKAVRPEYAY